MKLFKREKYLSKIRGFYKADDIIKVITGVRRCGKSSLMMMVRDELKETGVSANNLVYIDLDRREYRKIRQAEDLERLIEEQPVDKNDMVYLFIDEVQNVVGFEEVINGFRTEGGYSIFITGSNSYLLSGELMTKLTGRYVEFELFTLSFDEYEQMKEFYGIPLNMDKQGELASYIQEGGFPRTILLPNLMDKRTYVQNVVTEIFEKDIRKRVKIRDRQAFEIVRNFTINNFGATTSIKKLSENLRKQGLAISRQTLDRYIRALTDAKILYVCDRFDMKSKRALAGEKKYYLADLGFYFSLNTDNRINYGPALENIVYIYARSMGYTVSVGRIGKLECDFILRSPELNYAYVQVSYTIMASSETEDREYRPLEKIKDNYPKYIITADALLQKRSGIQHVNLVDFMKAGTHF